jgi:hypothetical protein
MLAHKRQFIWQILLPILLVVLAGFILGGFTIGAALSNSTQAGIWANVSIIWMIAPLLFFALFFVVVLGFLIYAIAKLTGITPRYTGKVQMYAAMAAAGTRKVADGVTKPIVWIHQVGAAIQSFFNKL